MAVVVALRIRLVSIYGNGAGGVRVHDPTHVAGRPAPDMIRVRNRK